ncbi:MAG: hypothetical protein HUJ16_11545 [Kangiella sp.]|nr:hypothetical protein [Kangiella sp.]
MATAVPQSRARVVTAGRGPWLIWDGIVVLGIVIGRRRRDNIKNASHYHLVGGGTIFLPFQKSHFLCEKSQIGAEP